MKYDEYIDLKKNDRKNQAVICAAQLFLKKGIANVKMTDIAEESEIGVASLYRYFKTKKQLVLDVGTYLWNDLKPIFCDMVNCKKYHNANGITQVRMIGTIYEKLFRNHTIFLNFISDFDIYVHTEGIHENELIEYEKSIFNFYDYFEKAVLKGRNDGTVRKDFDIRLLYLTGTHALMALCQKLSTPQIITSDSDIEGIKQVEILIDTLTTYLK